MSGRGLPGVIAALTAIALSGCMVGPNYKAPTVPAPPAYSDAGHNGACDAQGGDFPPAHCGPAHAGPGIPRSHKDPLPKRHMWVRSPSWHHNCG